MLVRVGNMILASLALVVCFMAEAGCHSALSPSPSRPHHGPVTVREILMDAVVIFWFVAALALSSKRRIAWIGSLLGTGVSACFFGAGTIVITGLCLFPSAGDARNWGVSGRIFLFIFAGGMCLVFLATSVGLFVGLLRMRKELR